MSLKYNISSWIELNGPMSVSTFMQLCLHDPIGGYYATRPGLGRDFITAPEISQVFGELIGAWTAHEAQALGRASRLIELGPGRGTLMADALRNLPDTSPLSEVTLVEASPILTDIQKECLKHIDGLELNWVTGFDDLSPGPAIMIANEFVDCLPTRQFLSEGGKVHEVLIGLGEQDALQFGKSEPLGRIEAEQGAAELQPGLAHLVETLTPWAQFPFRALFVDYGPMEEPTVNTLRAFRNGEQEDPLANPGLADLTVDVDFARFVRLANAYGFDVAGPITQTDFLMSLGAQARLDQLVQANPDKGAALFEGVRRLVDPAELGDRFKVICLSSPGLPKPAGF